MFFCFVIFTFKSAMTIQLKWSWSLVSQAVHRLAPKNPSPFLWTSSGSSLPNPYLKGMGKGWFHHLFIVQWTYLVHSTDNLQNSFKACTWYSPAWLWRIPITRKSAQQGKPTNFYSLQEFRIAQEYLLLQSKQAGINQAEDMKTPRMQETKSLRKMTRTTKFVQN